MNARAQMHAAEQATLTASDLREWADRRLKAAGLASAALDARVLLEHALGLSREAILAQNPLISDNHVVLFDALVARRLCFEPVAKIIGRKAFWKHEFLTSQATLDPRPDSETLLTLAQQQCQAPPQQILDLGTGTGCLLLSLLAEYPSAHGVGVDLSAGALRLARRNAMLLGQGERACFIQSDWCAKLTGRFDLIVANPPYIAELERAYLSPDVAHYEPELALFGGEDGLECYRSLLPQLPKFLSDGGVVVLEIGAGQAAAVASLAEASGLMLAASATDLGGIVRALAFRQAPATA